MTVLQNLQSLWVLDSNEGCSVIIALLALNVYLLYEHVTPHRGTIWVIAVLVGLKGLTLMIDIVVLHVRQCFDGVRRVAHEEASVSLLVGVWKKLFAVVHR